MSEVALPDAGEAVLRGLGGIAVSREELTGAPLRCVPRPERLDRPLGDLRGVGEKTAAAAARIGLRTLGDLIENVPHTYGERGEITSIADASSSARKS